MERYASTRLFASHNKGIPHSLPSETPTYHTKFKKGSILHAGVTGNVCGHKTNEVSGRSRGCCSVFTKFSFHNVPCAQKRWLEPPDFQFKSPKRLCVHGTVQSDKHIQSSGVPSTGRLALQSGPVSSLLSSARSSSSQTVSAPNIQRETITDDVPPIWPQYCAKGIRIGNQLACSNSQGKRSKTHRLPGRLFSRTPEQTNTIVSRSVAPRSADLSRVASKHRQIHYSTTEEVGISWGNVGPMAERKIPPGGQSQQINPKSILNVSQQNNMLTRPAEPCGLTKLCQLRSSEGQALFSRASHVLELPAKQANKETLLPTRKRTDGAEMVATKLPARFTNSPTRTDSFPSDGCLRLGMGSTARRSSYVRDMDCRRAAPALQHEGNASHTEGSRNARPSSESVHDSCTVRQSNSDCSSTQRGWNEIHTITGTHNQNFPDSGSTSGAYHGIPHSGNVQWPCRPSVSTPVATRMAFTTSLHGKDISEIRGTDDRSVCVDSSSRCDQLCLTGSERQRSTVPRCLLANVELRTGMDLPATLLNSKGTITSQPSDGDLSVSGASLGTSVLEIRPEVSSASSTVHHPQLEPEPDRHGDRTSTSESSRDGTGSLEMWGWSRSLSNWNDSQIQLLRSSWRLSTQKTYMVAWKRWLQWCKKNDANPHHPTGTLLAKFLADLHLVYKLSYNTILLHKSVVATLCNVEDGGFLSSHTLVKHILKSIALKKPVSQKPPVWNIDNLASFMRSSNVDENNVFQTSRHTATLLLLCSGRRIHDLTLLAVDSEHLTVDNDGVTLWPVFGSKTDSCNYRQSGWRLLPNSECKNLDSVFWVNRTVRLLESRRASVNSNCLFLNIRGPAKAASRTVIAGWVKTLLTEAGIIATPGSVRSAVASKNWADNLPLDEILSRGNWRSSNTFTRFYRREVMPAPASSNITRMFNPIN